MKIVSKITLVLSIILLLNNSTNAQCITGAGGTVYPGTTINLTGNLYIQLGATFYYTMSISGSNIIQNLGFKVDTSTWLPTATTNPVYKYLNISAGNHLWKSSGTVSSNAPCGATETVTITIYQQGGGLICQSSFTFTTPPAPPVLSIAGVSQVCGNASTNITLNGATCSGCTYYWTSSNTSWKGNSQSFPITTTSNTINVYTTNPGSSTTITGTIIGLSGYCSQPVPATKNISSNSFSLTLTAPDQCGILSSAPQDALKVTATNISGASYAWYKRDPGTTNWYSIGGANINYKFYNSIISGFTGVKVVVTNAQGCTQEKSMELLFCSNQPTCCNALRKSNDPDVILIKNDIGIFPNPTSGIININMSGAEGMVEIYNYEGKRLLTKVLNPESTEVNLSELSSGIYLTVIKNNSGEVLKTERVILN